MQGQLFKPFRFVLRQYIQALTVTSLPKYVAPDHWEEVRGRGVSNQKTFGTPIRALFNPRTYKGGGWMPPHKVFLSFYREDKNHSAPDVFSSCSFISLAQ